MKRRDEKLACRRKTRISRANKFWRGSMGQICTVIYEHSACPIALYSRDYMEPSSYGGTKIVVSPRGEIKDPFAENYAIGFYWTNLATGSLSQHARLVVVGQ